MQAYLFFKGMNEQKNENGISPIMASSNAKDIETEMRRFWWFSLVASLNHALNYVVNAFATSLLGSLLGGIILFISWFLNGISGLTVATPVVRRFGYKYAMIISFAGYTFQIFTVWLAIVIDDNPTAWFAAILGSTVSGITSSIWWTAQGVGFETCCLEVAKLSLRDDEDGKKNDMMKKSTRFSSSIDSDIIPAVVRQSSFSSTTVITKADDPVNDIRAKLGSHWTVIYQSADLFVFILLSLIPSVANIGVQTCVFFLSIIGLATTFLGFTFQTPKSDQAQELSYEDIFKAIYAVPKQYSEDSRVGLLSPFVFGFGISTALFAVYYNPKITDERGNDSLGYLEAYTYFVAICTAVPYAFISTYFKRGQDWVFQFGSFSFMMTGVLLLVSTDDELTDWTFLLLAKGFYGLGRGVFEGSCRAIYAEMFTGEQLSSAFSGQTLSAGFSGGIACLVFAFMSKNAIGAVALSNGIIAIIAYFVIMYVIDAHTTISWSKTIEAIYSGGKDGSRKTSSNSLKTSLLDGNTELSDRSCGL